MKTKKPSDNVFSTTDAFGNLVILKAGTWDLHILDEHPEMSGYETLVEQVVHDPFMVRTSTQSAFGLVFISEEAVGPSPDGIRVVAKYDDLLYEKGSSSGVVSTAYGIDWIKYASPKLGRIIYQRGGGK